MANELPWVFDWAYDRLIGGPVAGRVHEGTAPQGETFPYIVVQLQSPGADVTTLEWTRIWAEPLLLVKAVNKTRNWATLSDAADWIDDQLHQQDGTTDDGRILQCVREGPFSLIEYPGNVEHRHLGGFYRVRVRPL